MLPVRVLMRLAVGKRRQEFFRGGGNGSKMVS